MARYIDADYLDTLLTQLVKEGRPITRNDYKIIDNVLYEFPTADVVEVVRCGECRCGQPYKHTNEYVRCEADVESIDRDSDFFCAYGERRETCS